MKASTAMAEWIYRAMQKGTLTWYISVLTASTAALLFNLIYFRTASPTSSWIYHCHLKVSMVKTAFCTFSRPMSVNFGLYPPSSLPSSWTFTLSSKPATFSSTTSLNLNFTPPNPSYNLYPSLGHPMLCLLLSSFFSGFHNLSSPSSNPLKMLVLKSPVIMPPLWPLVLRYDGENFGSFAIDFNGVRILPLDIDVLFR